MTCGFATGVTPSDDVIHQVEEDDPRDEWAGLLNLPCDFRMDRAASPRPAPEPHGVPGGPAALRS